MWEQCGSWAMMRDPMDAVSSWLLHLTDHPIRSFLIVALWTAVPDQHFLVPTHLTFAGLVCTRVRKREQRLPTGCLAPLEGTEKMSFNEFRRPVSVDSAPRGSRCEWCGKPAIQQLTAIGGSYHNDSGLFCSPCGEKFSQAVMNSLSAAPNEVEAR
jgi:hypothetical protein